MCSRQASAARALYELEHGSLSLPGLRPYYGLSNDERVHLGRDVESIGSPPPDLSARAARIELRDSLSYSGERVDLAP